MHGVFIDNGSTHIIKIPLYKSYDSLISDENGHFDVVSKIFSPVKCKIFDATP